MLSYVLSVDDVRGFNIMERWILFAKYIFRVYANLNNLKLIVHIVEIIGKCIGIKSEFSQICSKIKTKQEKRMWRVRVFSSSFSLSESFDATDNKTVHKKSSTKRNEFDRIHLIFTLYTIHCANVRFDNNTTQDMRDIHKWT